MGTLKTLKPLEILYKLPNPGIKGGGETLKMARIGTFGG